MSNLDFRDPSSTPSKVDDLIVQAVGSVLRHALTGAAGALVAAGAMQSDQTASFVAIGAGAAMYAIGQLWSIVQKARTRK